MNKATFNGVTLSYNTIGEGCDIVLIHGLATSHAFWHLKILSSLAESHRLTIYDQRGHGYSEMPRDGYTSRDMAEDIRGLMDFLDIEKAHLVGHSLGGVVALHMAASYPERVMSLVIADSRVRAIQPSNFARDWPNMKNAMKKLAAIGLTVPEDEPESGLWLLERLASPEWMGMTHKLDDTPLSLLFGKWNNGRKRSEKWRRLMETTTARKDIMDIAGLTTEALSTIRKPVLAVYGENSPTLPSMHGLKKLLPDLREAVIQGAGHFHPLEMPDVFVEILNRHFNELKELTLC